MAEVVKEVTVCPVAVQATNDSSCVSKLSAARAGYFEDAFLTYFVGRQQRRAPLIHWGYYIRSQAVGHVINSFLHHYGKQKAQIISLGAGFDTAFFRLSYADKLNSIFYVEVDFPPVVSRKLAIINSFPLLNNMASVTHYKLIGCDITALDKLSNELAMNGVDYSLPTLLIAEVVLTYIKPDQVNSLLLWAASSFSSSCFCTYEQICPHDGFGSVMLHHFQSISSPLLNIHQFPTLLDQQRRYQNAGWTVVRACDMNQFLSALPKVEMQRLLSLEMFDEFEELQLKCGHYMLLCALNGSCSSLSSSLSLPPSLLPDCNKENVIHADINSGVCIPACNQWKLNRFSHSSVLLTSGHILVYGGFGYRDKSGAQGRLNSLVTVKPVENIEQKKDELEDRFKVEDVVVEGEEPPGLLHHTMTLLPDGVMLLIGGRMSPCKPNPHQYILKSARRDTKWVWSILGTNEILARWRHTATLLGNGCVLIVGGCSLRGQVFNDIHLLDYKTSAVSKVPMLLPTGRHSHTSVVCGDDVIIVGGLDSCLHPVGTCFRLSCKDTNIWNLEEICFSPPIQPRHSMAGECVGSHTLILMGGVGHTQPSQSILTRLDLKTLSSSTYHLTFSPLQPIPLLHNFTAHWLEEYKKLIVVGGGGNCFSFGTHFNRTPIMLSVLP